MTGHKIKVDKKIIFYMGGFAGDLIASLYDPDVFIKFDEHTNYVKINHDAKQLKAIRNIKNCFVKQFPEFTSGAFENSSITKQLSSSTILGIVQFSQEFPMTTHFLDSGVKKSWCFC